jgi:hypothetical protein
LEFDMPYIAAGASLLGGVLGSRSAEKAARTKARSEERAAQLAADEARFRPVGITTRFGQSQFKTDKDGRVTGASYSIDPELRAYQDRFMNLAGGGLSQAEMAQQQFAPLDEAAQGLFSLGQGYLAQTPQQAAQQFMAQQQELLAPSRERQMAQLNQGLFNTGRGGLAVGATGARPSGAAGLGAASPEVEAYYNALAQQDALLATQATQGGMDQARFGAGLFATGGNLLTQGYQGQTAALGPYEAYLEQMKQIEALGQQPLELGINIGAKGQSTAGANALLQGGTSAAQSRFAADAYNPFATALVSAGQNPRLQDALARQFGRSNTGPFLDVGGYGAAGADALAQYGI